MRYSMVIAVMLPLLAATHQARAEAGGCVKYGAAGAIAGHAVGHGVKGALAGCATGMVVRHEARKSARARARAAANAAANRTVGGQTAPAGGGVTPGQAGSPWGQPPAATPR